jgi:hypothetical protein
MSCAHVNICAKKPVHAQDLDILYMYLGTHKCEHTYPHQIFVLKNWIIFTSAANDRSCDVLLPLRSVTSVLVNGMSQIYKMVQHMIFCCRENVIVQALLCISMDFIFCTITSYGLP